MTDAFLTLVPDVKKVFLKNFVTSLGVIVGIAVLALIIHFTAGLDVFMITFEALGVDFRYTMVVIPLVVIYAVFLGIILANSFILRSIKYEFYQDRIVIHEIKNVIFIEETEVYYRNISRVYAKQDALSSLFSLGTIVFDLTGTTEEKKELVFVTKPEEVVQQIHSMLQY